MIYGVGTDIVQLARMQSLWERWGDKLGRRLLSPWEHNDFQHHPQPARFLAKRFAVKEAFAKALGTGIRGPVRLNAIGLEHDKLGKPHLKLSSELDHLLQQQGIVASHVSISDEQDYALAFVILEK